MTTHRFKVGDLVLTQVSVSTRLGEALLDEIASRRPSGVFEVIRLLPELGNGEPQYRIKCDGQPERVVQESHPVAVVHKPQLHH